MLLATHAFDIYTQIARQQSDSKANHFDYRHRQKCVTGELRRLQDASLFHPAQ